MRIELERLVFPEAAEEVKCALCKRPFTLELVIARALFWGNTRADGGEVCPECATYLAEGPMGEARPGDFPGEEDFARRAAEWRTPEYGSAEEADAAWRADMDRHDREEAASDEVITAHHKERAERGY